MKPPSHVFAFDDAPFDRNRGGDVLVIGTYCAGTRLEGVLSCTVRRDGVNSTRALARAVTASRFYRQAHAVLLQGINFAGFNVVDLPALHAAVGLPVLVVVRRRPRMDKIRKALLESVPGGARKWALMQKAGPMEPCAGVWVQREGIAPAEAARLVKRLRLHSTLPEPLRLAHLIAGGVGKGESRHRP